MSSYAGSDDVELLYLSGLGTRSSGPPGHWFIRRLSRRQGVVLALATLVVLALLSQYSTLPTQPIRVQSLEENDKAEDSNARPDKPHHVEVELDPEYANTLASSHLTDETTNSHKYYEAVLNGLPTAKFRDNLRNDTRYLTSWLSAGFTNDVMTLGNLIYLARMTDRIPILPPLDSYIGKVPMSIPFSSIFDLPRLSETLGFPVLEWQQVKDPNSTELDVLGCWNIWQVDNLESTGPRDSRIPYRLQLDLSYTRAPEDVKLIPGYLHDSHSSFWALAPLAFHDMRAKALTHSKIETLPAPRTGISMLPDEQLLCYDYLYYVCSDVPHEYDNPVYPSWDVVQKHFRWTAEVERVGNQFLRRVLEVPSGADIPPYITIHVRHGDFENWCPDRDREGCFNSLDTYAIRVAEVQQELRERKGINVTHVFMTSDEQDEKWWDTVKESGWLRIDHEKENTMAVYGEWYPVILDAYIQSVGIGFVGTDRSTFSNLARRRVTDWNDGVARIVKWGSPDADVH